MTKTLPQLRPLLTTRQKNKIDRFISGVVSRRCSGMQINVMDIGKVFDAGYTAATAGGPPETVNNQIEQAVVFAYTTLSAEAQG